MKDIQYSSNDFRHLKTALEARDLMKRAMNQSEPDVYSGAFKRYCVLASENDLTCKDTNNPVIVDFWKMMAALEQIYFEKHGKNVKAMRTRNKVKNCGELKVLDDWALSKTYTVGFIELDKKGLLELTGEYIIISNSDKFKKLSNFQSSLYRPS